MKNNKQGFSFVEIIVVIGIIVILAIVAVTSFEGSKDKAHNSKVETELSTLKNAYITYGANATLPLPDGNLNFYNQNGGYEHDYEGGNTFGISGFVTQNNLPKQYINILPLDPKTNQYYGYALTKKYNGFQLAGVFSNAGEYKTKLFSTWQGGINNDGEVKIPYLIKEYSGPNFVSENSEKYFPYNPEQNLLIAKIDAFSGDITINGKSDYSQEDIQNYTFTQGDTLGVSSNGWVDLYYSDGSYTVLGDKSQETQIEFKKMEFQDDTNLLTSIRVVLNAGTLWNKAVKLGGSSEFEIETPNAVASVRGTIFGVSVSGNKSNITVKQGKVEVRKKIGGEEIPFPQGNAQSIITLGEGKKSYIEVKGGEGSEPKGINVIGGIGPGAGSEVSAGNDYLGSIVAEKAIDIFENTGGYQEYLDTGKVGCQFGYRKISGSCMKIGVDIDIEELEATVVEKYKAIHNEVPTQAQIDKYIDESNGSVDAIVEKIKQDFNKNQDEGVSQEEWIEIARADYDVNIKLMRGDDYFSHTANALNHGNYMDYNNRTQIFKDGLGDIPTHKTCNYNSGECKKQNSLAFYTNREGKTGIAIDNYPLNSDSLYKNHCQLSGGTAQLNTCRKNLDYISYIVPGLLEEDFRLTFSLRGASLNRAINGQKYYLYDLTPNSTDEHTFKVEGGKIYIRGSLDTDIISISKDDIENMNGLIDGDKMYEISISYNDGKLEVIMEGGTLGEIDSELPETQEIFIGSKYINVAQKIFSANQWNDIIDSLVIYKKQ